MKKFATLIFVGLAALALAGCSATERGAGFGAAAGAIVGGVSTGTVTGAAVGAGIGGAAGALLGHLKNTSNTCVYEYPDGSRYTARCPDNVRFN
jgi:hypothetical protein